MNSKNLLSNQEIIRDTVFNFPGLRFHEIKTETGIANGTLQHHIRALLKTNVIVANYDRSIPRYYSTEINDEGRIIIRRLSQKTTSKIITALLLDECQTFSQLVKYTKKSPGTVSVYKNMLLDDKIIVGDTNSCKRSNGITKTMIKYRLVDPEKVRTLVEEYGKTSLQKSVDNLADSLLAIQ